MSLLINKARCEGKSIGLVPTMGALHQGHLRLVNRCQVANDVTVVSVFVNPTQFDKQADLDGYPRDLQQDKALLETAKVDYLFIPSEADMYPTKPLVSIHFGEMAHVMEGKYRKGHFEGVGIIVSKLLHIVQPDTAYFGLKDLQQFLLIKRMCADLHFQTKIEGVEIVREKSGLAMSSRNLKLSKKGLEDAALLYQGLQIVAKGIENKDSINDLVEKTLAFYQSKSNIAIEYLEVVNGHTLEPIRSLEGVDELAVCVAGYVEKIRLIDNLYLHL